jgi:hypothetical protein
MEQPQKGGSMEAPTGSMQSDANMPRQGDQTVQPASDRRSPGVDAW